MSKHQKLFSITNNIFQFLMTFHLLTKCTNFRTKEPPQIKFEVREELTPIGSVVGRLSEIVVRNTNISKTVNDFWIYKLLTDPKDSHFFEVHSASGLITTTRNVDRESISQCRGTHFCEIHLDVTVHEVGTEQFYQQHLSFQVLKVIISILDINDHQPIFRDEQFELSINEAAALDSFYILPTATDLDSPIFGIQEYKLDDATDTFSLVIGYQKHNVDPDTYKYSAKHLISDIKLSFKKKLDRETKASYKLKLTAIDSPLSINIPLSQPSSISNVLHIEIVILDSNDNRPEFLKELYEVTILENLKFNSPVVRVEANDADQGENGCVKYHFSRQTIALHGHIFSLDKDNGEISVIGAVDYEQCSIHQLIVIAHDQGPDVLSSEVIVIIRVKDENDNAPTLAIHTLSFDSGDEKNSQNSDNPINRKKSFEENIFNSVGKHPKTQSPLSYHNRNINIPGNFWVTKEMETSAAHAEISEDSPIKTFVAHLRVHDLDSGLNGHTNCSIVQLSTDKTIFTYDFNTRMHFEPNYFTMVKQDVNEYRIETNKPLDRERQDYYAIIIKCRDLGTPSRLSDKMLLVSITDVNDCAPLFQQDMYNVSLVENSIPGTSILHLNAKDNDLGDNGVFYFQLPETVAQFFNIDSSDGLLTTKQSIDREVYDNFRFPIIAVDNGKPPLTGSVLVEINIRDVNDERPIFIKREFFFNISEGEKEGAPVGYVVAIDKDSSAFNVHKFYYFDPPISNSSNIKQQIRIQNLTAENKNEESFPMSLDSTSGLISLRYPVDREQQEYFKFVIAACDIKQPSLSDTAIVFVQVTDINDNAPEIQFPYPIFLNHVAGGDWNNDNVMDINLSTVKGLSGPIKDLKNDTKMFGDSFQSCMIFSNQNNSIQISNQIPATSPVARVIAKDKDAGINALLQFSIEHIVHHYPGDRNSSYQHKFHAKSSSNQSRAIITSLNSTTFLSSSDNAEESNQQNEGPNNVHFRINKTVGILYTAQDLNILNCACISISLKVTDSGNPSLSSQSYLFVHVNNSLPYVAPSIGDLEIFGFELDHSDQKTDNVNYDSKEYLHEGDSSRNKSHTTTLLAIISGCGMVILLLSVAITLLIRRKERERRNRKYNCRVEALRMLTNSTSSLSNDKITCHSINSQGIVCSPETSFVRKSLLQKDKLLQPCPVSSERGKCSGV